MAIYQILEELKDARKDGDQCEFNGFLKTIWKLWILLKIRA